MAAARADRIAQHRDLEHPDEQPDRQRRDRAADQQIGQDLAGDHLPGVDRGDPEQLDDPARSLPNEGERDERDGQVLEDQREDGGPEVGEDAAARTARCS